MENKEVIRQLENYMIVHKLKKYELARAIGTTEMNIYRWLNGKSKMSKAWVEVMKSKGILKERG